jgi:hypothetical protein
MLLAPRSRSTAADLLRLMAVWLAALLLLQSGAAALVLGQAQWHRHRPAVTHAFGAHHHGDMAQHQHSVLDASVQAADTATIDPADLVLAAALAWMACAMALVLREGRRHVWCAARAWAAQAVVPEPWLRPPRPA